VLHRTVSLSVGSPFTWMLVSLFQVLFHLLPLLPFPVGLARTHPGHPVLYTSNPLNAELNPVCRLLALLGAHHFLHVSRIRVKYILLTYPDLGGSRQL